MRVRGPVLAGLVFLGSMCLGVGGASAATNGLEFASSFNGSENVGLPGGFAEPYGVAVDQADGDVYVADVGHQLVDRFDASGVFQSDMECAVCSGRYERSVAVDEASGGLYVADSGPDTVFQFKPSGEYEARWTPEYGYGYVYVAVDNSLSLTDPDAGDAYVAASSAHVVDLRSASGGKLDFTASESYISGSELEGTPGAGGAFTPFSNPQGVAVDSSNGDLYVDDESQVDVFSPTGEFIHALTGVVFSNLPLGIAVDGAGGEVYVADPGAAVLDVFNASTGVLLYELSGTPSLRFGAPQGVGVDEASGNVYVSDVGAKVVDVFGRVQALAVPHTAAPTNITATSVSLNGDLNPNGGAVSYFFRYGKGTSCLGSQTATGSAAGTNDIAEQATLEGLEPDTEYAFCLYSVVGQTTRAGSVVTFKTKAMAPTVSGEVASGITQTDATLRAEINPNDQATTYQFQLGRSAAYGVAVPASAASVGAGFGDQAVSNDIGGGLLADTIYHFRVVAENASGETTYGPDRTFVTQPANPTTGGTASLTQASVLLSGAFNPGGVDTHYYFQYGVGGANVEYWQGQTPSIDAGSGTSAVEPSVELAGLQALTTYHYRLVVVNASGASYGQFHEFATLPAPAEALGPVILTTNSALIEVGVTPVPGTSYAIEYGPGTSYGLSLPVPAGEAGSGSQLASVELTGLNPYEIYHYRLNAISVAGTSYGPDQQFLTESLAPEVSSAGAQSVGETSATLTGAVNPRGINTTYYFQYGTSESYGASVPLASAYAGAGTTAVSESASIVALAPASTYHFRIVASSRGGTVYGADQTFTTAAAVSATAPKVSPPAEKLKPKTKAQELASALKACSRQAKQKRAACVKRARKKYGATPKKRKKPKK
jgi:DNA-binding beta-propeller fold protein YncE